MNRKEIVERQQAILDAAKREGRELTAEETREFESLQRSLDEMDAGEGQQGQRGQEGGETPEQMVQRALAAERQRIADITALCRSFSLTRPNTFLPKQHGRSPGGCLREPAENHAYQCKGYRRRRRDKVQRCRNRCNFSSLWYFPAEASRRCNPDERYVPS